MTNDLKLNLVAFSIFRKRFKIRKSGAYLIVVDPKIKFAIHKSLFDKVKNLKNEKKILTFISNHSNLIIL